MYIITIFFVAERYTVVHSQYEESLSSEKSTQTELQTQHHSVAAKG